MRLYVLISCFSLMSCSGVQPLNRFAEPASVLEGGAAVNADYQLTWQMDGEKQSLLTHIEVDSEHFSFIGFGLLGEALIECAYSGGDLKCETLIESVPTDELIADIQLMFWPVHALQNNLNQSFVLNENGLLRELYYDRKLFAAISYENTQTWQSDITLKNEYYNYSINMKHLNEQ